MLASAMAAEPILISKGEARFTQRLIGEWRTRRIVTPREADILRNSVKPISFQWERLAVVLMIAAVLCAAASVLSAVLDPKIFQMIIDTFSWFFNRPPWIRGTLAFMASVAVLVWIYPRKWRGRADFLELEGLTIAALAMAASSAYCFEVAFVKAHFLPYCSERAVLGWSVYATLVSLFFISPPAWCYALLGYGYAISLPNDGRFFIHFQDKPVNFVLLGFALLVFAYLQKYDDIVGRVALPWSNRSLRPLNSVTRVVGCAYLYGGMWLQSVMSSDSNVWAITWGCMALLGVGLALSTEDEALLRFSQASVVLNVYCQFIRHYWNALHKTVIFLLLAASLYGLSVYAMKQWKAYRCHEMEREIKDD